MKNTGTDRNHGFFEKINYSASNEDGNSEREALQIRDSDVLLCITGSGARTLDLLIDCPSKIYSIDFNPTQNYLLQLKMATYQALEYQEFCEFLGIYPSYGRMELFQKIIPFLGEKTLDFWRNNLSKIRSGVLYEGTWEKLLNGMRKMAIFRKRTIVRLFDANTLEEQRRIWENEWDNSAWRTFMKLLCNRFLWEKIIREPGAKLIPMDFSMHEYLLEKIDHLAKNFLLRENHFANLIFLGKYAEGCILPPHLQKDHFETVKNNLGKITLVIDSLEVFLKSHSCDIDAFSLSDFSSYAPENMYHDIWEKVIQAASQNARFCERQFLVKREPQKIFDAIKRNREKELNLEQIDNTAIYTFCVGQIIK